MIASKLVSTSVPRGEPLCHGPLSDHKNEKQNQAVLAKAKVVFHKYSGLALDFHFSVKNHLSLRPLAAQESVASVARGRSQGG